MAIRISGPGVGLAFPRGVMPATFGAPFVPPTNRIELQSGQVLMVPAGNWMVSGRAVGGSVVTALQYLDPTDEQWHFLVQTPLTPPPWAPWGFQLFSDGFSYRVLNTAQVGTSAGVTAAGSGYAQATTVVTPSTGNSTWQAIIGGALDNPTVTNPGGGYTIPPLVTIAAASPPGVPATALATLAANGSVASITMTAAGAGYKTPPAVFITASPNDPNGDEIQDATATVELTGAGTVTAVLLKEFGAPVAAAPTLTITGSGSGATAVVNPTAWVAPATELVLLQPAAG